MGLKYFDEKSWNEITREERFFCAHLYNLIQTHGVIDFVQFLNRQGSDLPTETNWELGYEVCFFRDVWHFRGKEGPLYSPKRTFDLCLMSDKAIVVIEAKAQQGFDSIQLASIESDAGMITELTGVKTVKSVAIISSEYQPATTTRDRFQAIITWDDLSKVFGNDPILAHADGTYRD